jgi:hypothetical protein
MLARKVTMSGVVRPVETLSSAVVTPSVPIEAAAWPAMRQSCRVISTQEVLPLVPVTATTVSGTGKERRGQMGEQAARLIAGDVERAFHFRFGRATTATAPAAIAAGMKSSPLTCARQRPRTPCPAQPCGCRWQSRSH